MTKGVPCVKRIKELQCEESKERDVEDGWVETDSPMVKEGKTGKQGAESMDIDDLDMENVGGNEQDEEAVLFSKVNCFYRLILMTFQSNRINKLIISSLQVNTL